MERLKPVDVVIVGAGWSGLLMAKEITSRTSLSVVVLERGGPARTLPEAAATMDEVDYAIQCRMMQNLADETVTHRHSNRDVAVPMREYGAFLPGTGVGGSAEHYAGVTTRFLPDQFTLASSLKEMHGKNLPEGLAVQDWGFTYNEIEPYYWRAEQLMGCCGKAGNLNGKLIDGGNIFEGPRSHEFPNPPHKVTYIMTLFRKSALDLGYHPAPLPTCTLSQAYTNPDGVTRAGCTYCGFCSHHACMNGSKGSPSTVLLPVLRSKKNFALRTGCWVRRVIHRDGKAEGVTYMDASGEEKLQPADVVVLSSFTLNNSRLLLLSHIGEPYDSATGKGTVGKNLTHQVGRSQGLFFDKHLRNYMGAGGTVIFCDDFGGDRISRIDPSSGVLRGGGLRVTCTGEGPIEGFGRIPAGEVQRDWGPQWKKAAVNWQDRAGGINFEAPQMAWRQNYMDLDPTYTDKYGDPLIRFTFDWTDHDFREAEWLGQKQVLLAKGMGAKLGPIGRIASRHYNLMQYQSTHIGGGAIMGVSPENSVVNTWMQHWGIPNLWVNGPSAFPQNESTPALTIVATTLRAADAFVDRYLKKPGALA